MNDDLLYRFGVSLGSVALGVGAALATDLSRRLKRHRTAPDVTTTERDRRIMVVLTELRVRLGADRAFLSQFHNGGQYETGEDIRKKSRTHESVADGTRPESVNFQNMPVSLVPEEMKLVLEPGTSFTSIDELADGTFKRLTILGGTKAIARCAVRKGKYLVGMLGLDFNHDSAPPADLDLMLDAAGRIEQILAGYH